MLNRPAFAVALSFACAAPALAQDPTLIGGGGAPAAPAIRPEEPFQELPILTWQEELELQSTIRQVIFNAYLPLLARPTDYRGSHDDSIPNQVSDWDYQRPDVKNQLRSRQDVVDRQRRAHAGLPDAEINHLISKKKDFRQEQFEQLLVTSPRFEDLSVVVNRMQPLGNDNFRVDFDVKTKSNGNVETTKFDSIDVVRRGGTWLLPMKILLEVAPVARLQAGQAAGQPLDPAAFAGNFIAIAQNTLKDVLPFEIPFITGNPD
jgi:hypothetical protein